jgi:uncharacterized membrane protein YhaH (DUF805 family)
LAFESPGADVAYGQVRVRLALQATPNTNEGMCIIPLDRIAILAQVQEQGGGIENLIAAVFMLGLAILIIAGLWKTFEKAGLPGWGAIIPIYNVYLMCKLAGRPGWWVLLFLIPCVGIIIGIIVWLDIAKNFGKGAGFGLGLAFLGFIFIPILGFGDARYLRKKAYDL